MNFIFEESDRNSNQNTIITKILTFASINLSSQEDFNIFFSILIQKL